MPVSEKKKLGNLVKEIKVLKYELEELKNQVRSGTNPVLSEKDFLSPLIFRNSGLPFMSLNNNKEIIYVNDAWLRLLGYNYEEVTGLFIGSFIETSQLSFKNGVVELIDGSGLEIKNKDGETLIFLIYAVNLSGLSFNSNDNGWLMVDITSQKKDEKLLSRLSDMARDSEGRYRILVENQNDLVVKVDSDNRFLFVSPSYCQLFGKEEEELIGNSFLPLVHEDDRELTTKAMESLINEPFSCYIEQRAMTVKGWRWIAWSDKAILDDSGKIVSVVGVGRDITEIKEVEQKHRESENRLSNVLDVIGHGAWDWRIDLNETFFDTRFFKIAGSKPGDFCNDIRKWEKNIHPFDYELFNRNLKNHLNGNSDTFSSEIRILKNNGNWGWVRISGKVVERNFNGAPVRMLGTLTDIAKIKLVEEELRDKDREIANVMSKLPGLTYRCKSDGSWTMEFLSEGCLSLTGYFPDDFINNKILAFNDIISPEFREKLLKEWQNNLLKNRLFNQEYKIITKNGTEKWVWDQRSGVFDSKNNLIGLEGIILDITDRKRSDMIHQFQYSMANNLVTTHNVDEFLDVVNVELRKIFDFDGLVVGFLDQKKEIFNTIYEVGQEPGLESWPVKKSLSGIVIAGKKGLLFTDKEIIDLNRNGIIDLFGRVSKCWMGVPLIYEGIVIGVFLVQNYRTISAYDNKSLQVLEIIASQLSIYIEQKRTIMRTVQLSKGIEQSPVSIVITNKQGIIEYVNPQFCKVTGYNSHEAVGKNPNILKSGEHNIQFYKNLWQTILSGRNWEGELHNIKKNGEHYWEKNIISPIINEKGVIVQFIAFKEDVTEQRYLMADLVTAKDKAEESDRLKSAFLANLSHEIRTPMNAILGFTELLKDPEITDDSINTFVSIIHRSGNLLLGIINDIIEISKIETGQITPNFSEVNIGALIKDLNATLKLTIPVNKKIELLVYPPKSITNRNIITDEVKLTQMLTNLITNAIKFTGEGEVRFGYTEINGMLEFSVSDTGIGIDKPNHMLIFDRFYQIENDLRIKGGGSGLGLAISKAYVEMLGGEIWVESELNMGATFKFTIPLV